MKMVLTQGDGKVVLNIGINELYYEGKVLLHDTEYLKVGYIMKHKSILNSTCMPINFKDAVVITNLIQELMSVFDSQPSIETLEMLGYEESK